MTKPFEADVTLQGPEPHTGQENQALEHNTAIHTSEDDGAAETMDDATGCEFVDDRIRQLE